MSQAQVILGLTTTNVYCTAKKEIIKKKLLNYHERGGKIHLKPTEQVNVQRKI